jgi:hypothetical protein
MNEDIRKYEEFGYCLFRSIIDKEKLAKLEQDVLDAIREYKKNPIYSKLRFYG